MIIYNHQREQPEPQKVLFATAMTATIEKWGDIMLDEFRNYKIGIKVNGKWQYTIFYANKELLAEYIKANIERDEYQQISISKEN